MIRKSNFYLIAIVSLFGGLLSALSLENYLLNFWMQTIPLQIGMLLIFFFIFSMLFYGFLYVLAGKTQIILSSKTVAISYLIGLVLSLCIFSLLESGIFVINLKPKPMITHKMEINTVKATDGESENGNLTLFDVAIGIDRLRIEDFARTGIWIKSIDPLYPRSFSTSGSAKLEYAFEGETDQELSLSIINDSFNGMLQVKLDNQIETIDLNNPAIKEKQIRLKVGASPTVLNIGDDPAVVLNIMAIAFLSAMFLLLAHVLDGIIIIKLSDKNQVKYRALLYSIFYLLLIGIIKYLEVPELHFMEFGAIIFIYQAARAVYFFYLVLVFLSLGKTVMRLVRRSFEFNNSLDQVIFYLGLGSSVLNLLMFILGLLNGYYTYIMLVVTFPLVFLSYTDARDSLVKAHSFITDTTKKAVLAWFQDLKNKEFALSISKFFYVSLVMTAIMEGITLFLVHGLFPDRDGDVTTHYLPYYEAVVRNHGISPNAVWYHYFYNKGSGLFFLSNLLSDKYGAQLISFFYIFLSSLILYSILKIFTENRNLRWFIISLFLSILWIDSGFYDTSVAFSKLHILELSGLAYSLWVTVLLINRNKNKGTLFSIISGIIITGLFIFSTKNVIFILPFFCIVFIWLLLRKKWAESKNIFIIISILIGVQLGTMALNYITTGMFDDIPIRLMWRFADQTKFSQWISPFLMLFLLEGSGQSIGTITLGLPPFDWFVRALRVDKILLMPFPWDWIQWVIFFSLIIFLTICAVLAVIKTKQAFADKFILFFLCGIVDGLAIVIACLLNQLISLDRTYILTSFFSILIFVSLWEMGPALVLNGRVKRVVLNSIIFIGWILLFINPNGIIPITLNYQKAPRIQLNTAILKGINFISGKYSYSILSGDEFRDFYMAHRFIGLDKRILSLNYSFTMAGRGIEREMDYGYKEWHLMVFGEPEEAKQAFIREGINYFLISGSPNKTLVIGALPNSPLFDPDRIKENFDIIWKSKDSSLLTWKGAAVNRIPWDKSFLRLYKIKIAEDGLPELYDRIKYYYQTYGTNYPVYPDQSLPPVEGWQ